MPFLAPVVAVVLAATLTEIAVAVSIIGAGLSVIGAVTKNKTLMTIGTVMGAVGAVGGIGAALSGVGQMTVGQVASKAATTFGTQAASRVPGAASGIIAEAAKTGTTAAQTGFTEAAKAAASAAPKVIGGPVQNVATETPVTNAVVGNPQVTNTMDDLADDAANKFLKGMSGQGAMNLNGSGGTGLTAPPVEQSSFVKSYLSNMNNPVEPAKKSLLDSIDGTGKLMLATTGGQAIAGLAAGWFQGESAEDQLDFQKEMYAEQKRNRAYAPLV